MNKIMLSLFAAIAASPAFANGEECTIVNQDACSVSVPEISALEGTAALAVIATFVLIAWERRRRAA